MRDFRELITIGFNNLMAHRLRTTLSLIGIIVGITAIVIIASVGEGSKLKIRKEIKKWGTDILRIFPEQQHKESFSVRGSEMILRASSYGSLPSLTEKDLVSIRRNASNVSSVAPVIKSSFQSNKQNITVWGVDKEFQDVAGIEVLQGRFINERDVKMKYKICVVEINSEIYRFFKGMPKIGSYLSLNSMSFKIVGLVKRKTLQTPFIDKSVEVYIPISIMEKGQREYYAKVDSEDKLSRAAHEIESILQSRKLGKKLYKARSFGQILKMQNRIIEIVTLVIGGIAFLSLLVGGIGIMNVMLVSVGERKREIGIRIALGALRKDILLQFLIEAIILCSAGGFIGTIAGLIIAWVTAPILRVPFIISWKVAFIGVTFSVLVGILSGLYPAFKASRLDPIESLRYE